MIRVGVDIGGTFTDLIAYDEVTGKTLRVKQPTVPNRPDEGVLRVAAAAGIAAEDVSAFVHATTIVTNLIITRSGAATGLITTRGFRDVLEIGRTYRTDLYNLQWDKPVPLVPRRRVREVSERIGRDGSVMVAIDRDEVLDVVKGLFADGVQSIAVCLFNSYANSSHERAIADIVEEVAPGFSVSLSSDVDPRIREFERTSTTVLNAYAMPFIETYVGRLGGALGLDVKYMHSGGGMIPAALVRRMPVTMINSGPAAGVLAAKFLGEKIGLRNLITADVGGTSFDVCVIRDGQPDVRDQVEVEFGKPARIQSIDVTFIGAGGGSIARIDAGGALVVGPESAGAEPGPACYGRGGAKPTVTDANLVIGILNPENFLGGSIEVDPRRSRRALQPFADHFGMSVEGVADAVRRIVNSNMAQALFRATVRKGIDPRDFTLVAYGGGGGQHAVEMAIELGIPQVLFPLNASAFSAFGLLTADFRNTLSMTVLMPVDRLDAAELERAFASLEERGGDYLADHRRIVSGMRTERFLDMRYIGQSTEVPILLSGDIALTREAIYEAFEQAHFTRYGTRLGNPVEVVNVRVTVVGDVGSIEIAARDDLASSTDPKPQGQRKVWGHAAPLAVFDRDSLGPATTISGPCIIEEADSTIYVPIACRVSTDRFGNILAVLPRAVEQQLSSTMREGALA